MENKNVLDYLDKIDKAYLTGRVRKWSRYGKEWSSFSTPLNKEVRQKIMDGVEEEPLLQMVLPYWFNRSEMLEIYYTKKNLFKKSTLKRLKDECLQIRSDISISKINEVGALTINDIVRKAIKEAK